ncbi:MAG: ABC transporter substrate-binding protein [Cyclobacteriaceae bacterium]|nr:ABC transporter substrate-binding protein [Cyclobacteriaceae bacterium HetDA_MAG_MS6]
MSTPWFSELDQMGRRVTLPNLPKRIVSLVPSITEYLVDIGAPVVGRTKFCLHPNDQVKAIPIIGGTKKFDWNKIHVLEPDLIVGNKEENYEEGIRELEKDFTIWMSDFDKLQGSLDMMAILGRLMNREAEAKSVLQKIHHKLDAIENLKYGKVLYMIWKGPWMAAGKDTYIDDMLNHLGYENIIDQSRYPSLGDDDLHKLKPDIVMLSSEPFPFKEKHLEDMSVIFPDASIQLVDGEAYSWYGTRLLKVDF